MSVKYLVGWITRLLQFSIHHLWTIEIKIFHREGGFLAHWHFHRKYLHLSWQQLNCCSEGVWNSNKTLQKQSICKPPTSVKDSTCIGNKMHLDQLPGSLHSNCTGWFRHSKETWSRSISLPCIVHWQCIKLKQISPISIRCLLTYQTT